MRARKAEWTHVTYKSGWKMFCLWCEMAGRASLPTTPGIVSDFLLWCVNEGFRITTIRVRLNAIEHFHAEANYPSPVDASVRELLRLARRDRKESPKGRAALSYQQLAAICERYSEKSALDVRNRAMMLLGFSAGWRRSEVVALQLADVNFVKQGMTLWQASSKIDQTGEGRLVGIHAGKQALTCPIRALQAWLKLRGDWPGALFTKLTPNHLCVTCNPLRGRSDVLYRAVKDGLSAIGSDPAPYGAHSLRAGMITEATQHGASEASIKQRTGHKTSQSLQQYVRPATAFAMNPLAGVL